MAGFKRIARHPVDQRIYGFEASPDEMASGDEFFATHAADFHLGADDRLVEYANEQDAHGYTIRRYAQYYKGVPVFDGSYILHERNGRVVRGHGNATPDIHQTVVPQIDEPAAFATALRALDLDAESVRRDVRAPATRPVGQLGLATLPDAGNGTRVGLVYRYDLESERVDVDAMTGEIVEVVEPIAHGLANQVTPGRTYYDGVRSMRVAGVNNEDCSSTFYLAQDTEGPSRPGIGVRKAPLILNNKGGKDTDKMIDESVEYSETVTPGSGGSSFKEIGLDQRDPISPAKVAAPPTPCLIVGQPDFINVPSDWYAAIDILSKLEGIHDFLYAHSTSASDPGTGYVGFDGSRKETYYAFYVADMTSAFYHSAAIYSVDDPGTLFFGKSARSGKPDTDIDTIGHEFGHAVIHRSNKVTAFHGEAAFLDESFADMFAVISQESNSSPHSLHLSVQSSGCPDGLVDMAEPLLSCGKWIPASSYHDATWFVPAAGAPCDTTNDNCGAHINAGPADHFFGLLVGNGGLGVFGINTLGQAYNVFSLDFDEAGQIAWKAMHELGANPDYQTARQATLDAAAALFGDDTPGIDPPEYIAVMDAWCAVGVGECYGADWEATYGASTKRIVGNAHPWPYRSTIPSKYPYVGAVDFKLSDDVNFAGDAATLPATTDVHGDAYVDVDLDTAKTYYMTTAVTGGNAYCTINAVTQRFCTWMLNKQETSGIESIVTNDGVFSLDLPAPNGTAYPWDATFEWSGALPGTEKYVVQVSTDADADFENPLCQTVIAASNMPSLSWTLPTNKDLRYRAVAIGPTTTLEHEIAFALPSLDSNTFHTDAVQATLVSPGLAAHVPPWGAPLVLAWSNPIGTVSAKPTFGASNPPGTPLPYSGTTASISNLDTAGCGALSNGKACWWTVAPTGSSVCGNQAGETADAAPARSVIVDYALLKKPVLSVANPSYTFDTDPGATVSFSWNALPGADHFVIVVTKPNNEPAFSSVAIAGNKTSYNLFGVRDALGTMSATLTAYGPAPDNIPIASVPVTYGVTLAKPVINTPGPNLVFPYLYVPDDPISWTTVKGADHYQLMIQDPDGIVTTKAIAASAKLTVGNGVYQGDGTKPPTDKTGAAGYKIWVTAEGPAGSGISVASSAVTYLMGPRNPMGLEGALDAASAPTLSAPYVLHWTNETPGATYRLQLRDITLPVEDVVLDQPNIGTPSWNVNTFLKPAHKYAWDVVADLNGKKSSWSAMRYFATGGQCVPVIGAPSLSALNFKSGAGTAQDPYIVGSTGGKGVVTATLGVNAVPGATDYQVAGHGDGALQPPLSMDSGGTPWASGLISAETIYAAAVQARDQFGCWKVGNTVYIFKWTY
ncbi:MAG TPA: M4 family metallopeptidase [Rhodanobacteraceae bacterium]|nr:M4 family metallopeptidase [Rhodanobacteraceae bacterium]